MNIVACIKRVPTTDLQPRIGADGRQLDLGGVQFMTSFYDEIAVEEALRTKERHGGEVTVLTIGPADAAKELRETLAKGADKAVLLNDGAWMQRDALATAKALVGRIQGMAAELVLCGRVATDRDNAAVGPMMATLLGWSCVTDVVALEIVPGGTCTARREADGGVEVFQFRLPAVITCQKALNEPRYAALKGIMAAKKKPLEETPCETAASQVQVASLSLPPARKEGRILGQGAAAIPALLEALRNEAKVL